MNILVWFALITCTATAVVPSYVVRSALLKDCSTLGDDCDAKGFLPCSWLWKSKSCVHVQDGKCCCPSSLINETCSSFVANFYPRSIKVNNVKSGVPLKAANSTLPKPLRGIFWLQDQGGMSCLTTFAQTSPNKGIDQETNTILLKVDGDQTWSFSDYSLVSYIQRILWNIQSFLNIKSESVWYYKFHFDNATYPTYANITPVVLETTIPNWVVSFDMRLLPDGLEAYPGSIVWQRVSTILNVPCCNGNYNLLQIMDGNGDTINPAYDEWKEFMDTSEDVGEKGVMWYQSSNPNQLEL
jgi:hypothetical protein